MGSNVDLVEGGPPFARNSRAVIVTRDVEEQELELSFLDQATERFVGIDGWSVDPVWHRALRTTLPDGRTGFSVGPEITRFLRLNVGYVIATRSGLSAEIVSKVTTLQGSRPDAGIGFDSAGRRIRPEPTAPVATPPPPPLPPSPVPAVLPAISVPPMPATPDPKRHRRWLVGLLLLLLAVAAAYLATRCVVRIGMLPSSWQGCPQPPPPPPPPPPPGPTPPPPRGCQEQGCETGRLQVTLSWPTQDDLDLYVDCPGGESLYFSHRTGGCGDGKLDIDAQSERDMPNPVENVRWQSPPPNGRYGVRVQLWDFKGRTRRPIDYEVQVRLNDQFRSCKGRIVQPKEAGQQAVIAFTLPAAAAPGALPACTRPQP